MSSNPPRWNPQPAAAEGPPPPPHHSWFRRHKILTALVGIVALIIVIVVVSTSGGGGSGDTQSATTTKESQSQGDGEQKKDRGAAGIGTAVRDGKFEFTVTSVQSGGTNIGGEFGKDAQGKFIQIHLTVRNIGDQSQLFEGSDQKLFDAQNREFSADTEAAFSLPESQSFINDINPGNTVKGIVVFDVPKDITPAKIELHDSFLSGGVTVNLTSP